MKSLSPKFAGSPSAALKCCGLYRAIFFTTLFLIFAATAFAQEATIVGTVTDPSGAAVPNASITITNTETGVARTLPSSSDGQYVAPDLGIGHYSIRVTAAGFKAEEQKGLTLSVGDRTRYRLQAPSRQRAGAGHRRGQRHRGPDRYRRTKQRRDRSTDYSARHERTQLV